MALFSNLDIPSGLETLFAKALSILSGTTSGTIGIKQPQQTYKKRVVTKNRSLFVLWQSLYDGFTSGRRSAWQTYWGTLPFGDHGGVNEWPGSGYSAFVYVNAPRYKAGLDLLLDPPGGLGPELLDNASFSGSLSPWTLHTDLGDNFWSFDTVYFDADFATESQGYLLSETLTLSPGNYRITFSIAIPSDIDDFRFRLGLVVIGEDFIDPHTYFPGDLIADGDFHTYYFDNAVDVGGFGYAVENNFDVVIQSSPVLFNLLSLKKYF